jgi:hypothetical protein
MRVIGADSQALDVFHSDRRYSALAEYLMCFKTPDTYLFFDRCDLRHSDPCCPSPQSRPAYPTLVTTEASMATDDRDLLEILKFELRFLEDGGYGHSPNAPRRPSLVFEDSLTCMNFNSQGDRAPCSACLLMQFVPSNRGSEQIPCRHIPLDKAGKTLAALYESGTQPEIEEALGNWLRATIHRLEQERAATAGS